MAAKTVVYCKQNGKSPIPLTVQIEWLSSGTIKPLMYWTPDGTRYKVMSCSEATPLSLLKERGEGLRYKVVGEVVATPEPNDALLHTRRETYLYLADNLFCQKNIIDERYGHESKEFIKVTMDVFPDCEYELVYFWARGARYMVEKTLDVAPRASFQAGGVGIWHKVEARLVNADDDDDPDPHKSIRRHAALYRELNKWFVCVAKTA